MHYPFWYVPGLMSPMLIAIIATLHVFVAMFAVGGGLVMALGTHAGHRDHDQQLIAYFGSFAWFFVLITVVFGAITGVGVWWTIGLASPLATEELIHIFAFVWAMEYATFLVEIVSAFVFFHDWRRLDARTHQAALWSYAGSAWLSLVLITGITAFMLHSGNWLPGQGLWRAFWNPQAIPQIVARTGSSLLLAALFIFLHAAFRLPGQDGLRASIAQHAARWAMLGGLLVIVGGIAWFTFSPPSARAALEAAATLNLLMVLLFALTAIVVVMLYLGPYRHPTWVNPGFAILFFAMGFAATSTGEFVREAVRKPYVVYGSILGNGIRASEVPRARAEGLLNVGLWPRLWMSDHHPDVMAPGGRVDEPRLMLQPQEQRQQIGRVVFLYHCNDCHAVRGYSAISQLTRGKTRGMVMDIMLQLNRADFFMPPFSGRPEEAEVLLDYLATVMEPYPPGLVEASGEKSR
jgi:cytochrome d ubiquinol oxidase subunit I